MGAAVVYVAEGLRVVPPMYDWLATTVEVVRGMGDPPTSLVPPMAAVAEVLTMGTEVDL